MLVFFGSSCTKNQGTLQSWLCVMACHSPLHFFLSVNYDLVWPLEWSLVLLLTVVVICCCYEMGCGLKERHSRGNVVKRESSCFASKTPCEPHLLVCCTDLAVVEVLKRRWWWLFCKNLIWHSLSFELQSKEEHICSLDAPIYIEVYIVLVKLRVIGWIPL